MGEGADGSKFGKDLHTIASTLPFSSKLFLSEILSCDGQVRVQQTIKSQEGSITAYKITNLLQFYLVTMRRTIGEEALLSRTLKLCVSSTYVQES